MKTYLFVLSLFLTLPIAAQDFIGFVYEDLAK